MPVTRRRMRGAGGGAVLAVCVAAVLVLPGAAAAAVGGPYKITVGGASKLAVAPVTAGATLVVQARLTVQGVEFSPAAETVGPLAPGCDNATVPGSTTCTPASLALGLSFSGGVVEVGVHDVSTADLTFTGGPLNDIFVVSGTGTIATVNLAPGAGSDAMTVAGDVGAIGPVSADPGDDRYDIQSTGLKPETLALGDGSDVAANRSPNLTLDGGAGADTLSGPGPLVGGTGNDLLEPTVAGQSADGGVGTDRLSFDLIGTPLVLTKSGTNVVAGGVTKTGIDELEGGRAGDTLIGDGAPDVLLGGDGDDTIEGHGGGDTLDGGPGDNTVSYASGPSPVNVDLTAGTATTAGAIDHLANFRRVTSGPGNDTVTGSTADEVFALGAGDDQVNAAAGNDVIDGGPGNDSLRGGQGTDTIIGGDGRDVARYDERTASEPLSITLATPGDDGAPGENDTLIGVEDVIGGASSDVLVGDDGPNMLIGGGGLNTIVGGAGDDVLIGGENRDVIVGGPGSDQLVGAGDDDSLDAFDGSPDVVDCGPSLDDDAQVDATDQVSGCEFARRGDVPVPVDADGDGSVAGFDCNDADPTIGFAATEVPGDGIDQNCDGFDEALPLALGTPGVRSGSPTRLSTRITRLVVTELAAGSTVTVICTGPRSARKGAKHAVPASRRCPFTRRSARPRAGSTQVTFTKLIKRRALAVGTVVEVQVSAPGTIGKVSRYTIRASALPRVTDLCLLPGAKAAQPCPPDTA